MTGTPFCLLPVTSIHNKKLKMEKWVKLQKILNKWNDEVGLNIQKQISSWYASEEVGVSPYKIIKS